MEKPKTYNFEGFDIPIELMLLTGGGPDTFAEISRAHIDNLERHVGLRAEFSILEIGCGIGRDAIPLTKKMSRRGRYLGIDIIRPSIDWCTANISKRFPNFQFVHFDVKDELHNNVGTISAQHVRIPLPARSVDRIILQSVFTHMMRRDIEHYLREFQRVLKPLGLVYATMFIYDDAILEKARATNLTPFNLRFEYQLADGCRINDPEHPTGAVAYSRKALEVMLRQSGFRLAKPLLKGAWSGFYSDPDDGQDAAIIAPEFPRVFGGPWIAMALVGGGAVALARALKALRRG